MSSESVIRAIQARCGPGADPEHIQERVRVLVAERLGVEPATVNMQAVFVDDLGLDSLDVVELVMALEEEFNVRLGAP